MNLLQHYALVFRRKKIITMIQNYLLITQVFASLRKVKRKENWVLDQK